MLDSLLICAFVLSWRCLLPNVSYVSYSQEFSVCVPFNLMVLFFFSILVYISCLGHRCVLSA